MLRAGKKVKGSNTPDPMAFMGQLVSALRNRLLSNLCYCTLKATRVPLHHKRRNYAYR